MCPRVWCITNTCWMWKNDNTCVSETVIRIFTITCPRGIRAPRNDRGINYRSRCFPIAYIAYGYSIDVLRLSYILRWWTGEPFDRSKAISSIEKRWKWLAVYASRFAIKILWQQGTMFGSPGIYEYNSFCVYLSMSGSILSRLCVWLFYRGT